MGLAMETESQTVLPDLPPAAAVSLPERLLQHELTKQSPNLDVLDRLLAMQREWRSDNAKLAHVAALTAAKAELPVLIKNRQVGYDSKRTGDKTAYKHADLGEI